MLTLFCDTFGHLVTILDDSEFYDSGEPFSPHEYALLGQFLNQFLFKVRTYFPNPEIIDYYQYFWHPL